MSDGSSPPPPSPAMSFACQNLQSQLSHSMYNIMLRDEPEAFVNFSEALFGESGVVADEDIRRVPSVLSLFSEVSTGPEPSSSPSSGYPAFISPKNASAVDRALRPQALSSVTEAGSNKDIDGGARDRSGSMLGKIPKGVSFNDSLQKLGVQTVDVEDWDSDDEDNIMGTETAPPEPDAAAAPVAMSNPLYMTASFVQSMSEYAFRREALQKKIENGELVAKMTPSKKGSIAPHDQVNPDFYTDENQARRRHIKKHPQFVKIAERLWGCIDMMKDSEGCLARESYLKLSLKITLLIVPPPIDIEFTKKTALEDWENDTKGSGKLSYDQFFNSIFQLCDTWTESCNSEDYIEMLLHVIDGICKNEKGDLHFKADEQIKYDQFFSFLGDLKETFVYADHKAQGGAPREPIKPSTLVEHVKKGATGGGKKKGGGKRKRGGKGKEASVILPLDKCLALIGKIYQEKSKTDLWIARKTSVVEEAGKKRKSKSLKKLRFDAFIMKYFTGQHGTRGIARRHLRNFVVSLQHHSGEHPRVDLFRKLSGVPQLSGVAEPYIPTLVGRYYIPLLNHVVEAGDTASTDISKLLNKEVLCRANLGKVLEKVQVSLAGVFFGSRMFENFKNHMMESHCVSVGSAQMVDLDQAMDQAYSMFVYSDGMRAFSHVRGARCLQRWFRAGVWPPRMREVGVEVVGGEVEGEVREVVDGQVDREVEKSKIAKQDTTETMSSPRQKLVDAQKLDGEVNG